VSGEPERRVEAVLLSGVYGTGKSSVGAEIADILEKRNLPYGLIDLDFLAWVLPAEDADTDETRILAQNLAAVAGTFLAVGIRYLVLAGSVRDQAELQAIRSALDADLRVVRLTLPFGEIERRLASDVTAGRKDDLREAAAWLAAGTGEGIEDLVVANDRPVRAVADEILDSLGWKQDAPR
jgi:hypothetical protein